MISNSCCHGNTNTVSSHDDSSSPQYKSDQSYSICINKEYRSYVEILYAFIEKHDSKGV